MRKVLWLLLLPLLALLAGGAADADTVLSEDRVFELEVLAVEGNLTITNGSMVVFRSARVEFETSGARLTVDSGATLVLDDTVVEGNTTFTGSIAGAFEIRDSQLHNLTALEVTGAAVIHGDSRSMNTTLTVEGELTLFNATPQAALVLDGGWARLWNSTLANVTYNTGELVSGYLLQAVLLTPFSEPVADADWEVEVPGLGWRRTGQAGAFGQTPWLGVPTAIRNASGEVSSQAVLFNMSHPDEGGISEALNPTANTFLRLQLEIDLRVKNFWVDGGEEKLVDEPFTLNVKLLNVGSSSIEVTGTLNVVNPLNPLSAMVSSDGKPLTAIQQLQLELGEERVMRLETAGIPEAGQFSLYFRLFVNHTVVSPIDGSVEIIRNLPGSIFQGPRPGPNGTTLPGEILALITTPSDDQGTGNETWANLSTVRAPGSGVISRIYATSGTRVTAGTPLMQLEINLGSASTDLSIEQSPEPPETLLGMEYKTWTYLLLFTTGLGVIGVAALWWRARRPNT